MSRKKKHEGHGPQTDWTRERTLADVEAEEASPVPSSDTACICGSEEFLLEAYLHVVRGVARPEPVEVEALTCPDCSREYEAIQGEGGTILRGDFLGWADLDEDED